MADAYESSQGDLAERLLAALEAGQAAGGDIRGQQSAAILVVSATSTGRPWVDRQMELRVEDHPEPLIELRRLALLHRAYQLMNQGDEHLGRGKVDEAFAAYQEAARLAPEVDELPFWEAVSLVNIGRLEEALPIFRRVFSGNPGWAVLVQRLTSAGMLSADAEAMRRILDQSH
jgi:uncharacterized Ntn-hydrolase superfamily protein